MLGLALIYPDVVSKLRWTVIEMQKLEPKLERSISDPHILDRLIANRRHLTREADLLYHQTASRPDDETVAPNTSPAAPRGPLDVARSPPGRDMSDQDLLIVARYRRICQHGIGAVGIVKATAEALGDVAAARRLARMLGCIQASDKALVDLTRQSRLKALKEKAVR